MKTKNIGWVALIIALIVIGLSWGGSSLGGSTSDDWNVGGNLTVAGTSVFTGAISTAGISATTGSFSSTLGVTSTSTLSDTVIFNNPGICIDFYATSSATRVHMIASSTASVTGQVTEAGVMLFGYGACAL